MYKYFFEENCSDINIIKIIQFSHRIALMCISHVESKVIDVDEIVIV
jgi:hypothetical protein